MSENPAWRMGELLRIAVLFLWDKPDGAATRAIMEAIAHSARLSVEETIPEPGSGNLPRYAVALRSAMTALEKAGWLAHQGNAWVLTEEGRLVCRDFRQASDFFVESQKVYQAWQVMRPASALALEYAREQAWAGVRAYLLALTHYEFRTLVADLLTAMGYYLDWIAPAGKLRGQVDLIARPEPLRGDQPALVVQVKHSGQAVSAENLKALLASTHAANLLLCVSSSGFAPTAREFAGTLSPDKLVLMDLEEFVDLWVGRADHLTPAAHQRFPLEAIPTLALPV